MNQPVYTIEDLVLLMRRLRHPEYGCPWDIKQDFKSIVPSTLEEVYEVVEAIENEDYDNLQEELGDLLFQVIFYAQMADEDKKFDFNDIAHGIVSKLVRRHPHVFPDGVLNTEPGSVEPLSDEELHIQWEKIKQEEKQSKGGEKSLLSDVPRSLPALQRAYKLQKKMRGVGFDWQSPEDLFPIVEEELKECREAHSKGNFESVEEELGDILFAVTNLARHLKVDPETALRKSNDKVTQRFNYIEEALKVRKVSLEQAELDEMEGLWQEAKLVEKGGL